MFILVMFIIRRALPGNDYTLLGRGNEEIVHLPVRLLLYVLGRDYLLRLYIPRRRTDMNNEPEQDNQDDGDMPQATKLSATGKAEGAATQAGKLLGGISHAQAVTDAANQARADAERSMREASSAPGTAAASSTPGATGDSAAAEEEEFVGTGGVGSPEQMEALRRGHEAAGDEYQSNLKDPNKTA
jgi:hypothetical protein